MKKQYFYFYWSNILLYVSVLLLKYLICVLCPPLYKSLVFGDEFLAQGLHRIEKGPVQTDDIQLEAHNSLEFHYMLKHQDLYSRKLLK